KVFRAAAVNLLAHRDLYAAHPDQHFDFYKYSPTFALLFAPLAALPFAPALLIWSLLNSLLLWYAVRRLLPDRQATLALALVYLEVLCGVAVALGLALLPLLVIPPHELIAQYRSWWTIETADASRVNRGDSVMQYLHQWLGMDWPNWPLQLAGTLLLLAPLALQRPR